MKMHEVKPEAWTVCLTTRQTVINLKRKSETTQGQRAQDGLRCQTHKVTLTSEPSQSWCRGDLVTRRAFSRRRFAEVGGRLVICELTSRRFLRRTCLDAAAPKYCPAQNEFFLAQPSAQVVRTEIEGNPSRCFRDSHAYYRCSSARQ